MAVCTSHNLPAFDQKVDVVTVKRALRDPSQSLPSLGMVDVRSLAYFFQRAPRMNPITAAPANVVIGFSRRDFLTRDLYCSTSS